MLNKDLFLTNITNAKVYKSFDEKNLNNYESKKNFFLHLKLKKPITRKAYNKFKPYFSCKQINFKKKFVLSKLTTERRCRIYSNKDKLKVLNICKEKTSYSRFVKDKRFRKMLKYPFRYYWLQNFFKKKNKNTLIVCDDMNKIKGFLLLKKNKDELIINMLCTSERFSNQNVATSMLAFTNNKFMRKNKVNLFAGTQNYNKPALKFYKKNNFKIISTNYIYHIKK